MSFPQKIPACMLTAAAILKGSIQQSFIAFVFKPKIKTFHLKYTKKK